jgi:hypothetical protein
MAEKVELSPKVRERFVCLLLWVRLARVVAMIVAR